jgi:hypothetical protein
VGVIGVNDATQRERHPQMPLTDVSIKNAKPDSKPFKLFDNT